MRLGTAIGDPVTEIADVRKFPRSQPYAAAHSHILRRVQISNFIHILATIWEIA